MAVVWPSADRCKPTFKNNSDDLISPTGILLTVSLVVVIVAALSWEKKKRIRAVLMILGLTIIEGLAIGIALLIFSVLVCLIVHFLSNRSPKGKEEEPERKRFIVSNTYIIKNGHMEFLSNNGDGTFYDGYDNYYRLINGILYDDLGVAYQLFGER